MTIIERS